MDKHISEIIDGDGVKVVLRKDRDEIVTTKGRFKHLGRRFTLNEFTKITDKHPEWMREFSMVFVYSPGHGVVMKWGKKSWQAKIYTYEVIPWREK